MAQSQSLWQRLKIRNAYGQLVALIFVPISILTLIGSYLVYREISITYELQRQAQASLILQQYQTTAQQAYQLKVQSSAYHYTAQQKLQTILNEKQILRAVIIDSHKNIILSAGQPIPDHWLQQLNVISPSQLNATHKNIYFTTLYSSHDFQHQSADVIYYWLVIELNPQAFLNHYYHLILALIVAGFISLILLLLCLNLYARQWIIPIYEMRFQLQSINTEQLKTIDTPSSGELNSLQTDINRVLVKLNTAIVELRQQSELMEHDFRQTLDRIEGQNLDFRYQLEQVIHANKSKTAFLANISHELRTPLNSIDGFVSLMLRNNNIDDKNRLYLQTIHKSSGHLLALINDVLDFSKIDAGKLALEVMRFPLESTIFDVLDMLSPSASNQNLNLVMSYDENLPIYVKGDVLRFKQILTNLVSNAIKFTHEGEIIVRVKLEEQQNDRILIHFTVQDSGIGLIGVDSNKLFSSFSQGDNSITRQYGGTGLGLAISKQLVQLMNGKIGFINNQERNPTEKGASFWFTAEFKMVEQSENQIASIQQNVKLNQYHVISYFSHASTSHILQQYLEQYQIASHHTVNSIIELFSQLNAIHNNQKTFVIVEQTGDLALLLKEIRQRYTGHIAVYGYQTQLDPDILKQYHAVALAQPLSRLHLLNLFNHKFNIEPHSQFNGEGLHILAVDDHLPNLMVLDALLTELNIKVDTANSGQMAVSKFQTNIEQQKSQYDLIFMDIQMPIMSGIETTQAIRLLERDLSEQLEQKQYKSVPIIALTAHAMSDEKQQILNLGMNDYISKPIQLEQLIETLNKWVIQAKQNQHIDTVFSHFQENTKNTIPNKTKLIESKSESNTISPLDLDKFHHLAVINWQQSIELAANKIDLAQDLLKMLIDSFEADLNEMQQLIDDEDYPQLEPILHRIAGGTRYIGVPQLQYISTEYEQFIAQLRKQQQKADESFMQQAQHYFDLFTDAIHQIRLLAPQYLEQTNQNRSKS